MPHKSLNPDKLPLVEQDRNALSAPLRQFRKRKTARQLKGPRRAQAAASRENRPMPRILPVMRIRRLIMAALRVWELKHGIHEPHWIDFDQQELLHPIDDF